MDKGHAQAEQNGLGYKKLSDAGVLRKSLVGGVDRSAPRSEMVYQMANVLFHVELEHRAPLRRR